MEVGCLFDYFFIANDREELVRSFVNAMAKQVYVLGFISFVLFLQCCSQKHFLNFNFEVRKIKISFLCLNK